MTQYRLGARCPDCRAAVRLRNSAKAMQLLRLALEDPDFGEDDVIQTYQCSRRHDGVTCNAIVQIRVRDWNPVEY